MAVQHPVAAAKYQQCFAVIDETINLLLMWGEHRKRKAAQIEPPAVEIVVAPVAAIEAAPAAPPAKSVSKPRPTAVKSSAVKSLQASGIPIPKPLQAKMAQATPTATKSAPPEPQAKRSRMEEPEPIVVQAALPTKAAPAKTPAVVNVAGDNDVSKLKARLAALKEKAAQLEAVEAKRAKAQAVVQKVGKAAQPPTKAIPTLPAKSATKAAPTQTVNATRPRPPVPVFEVAETLSPSPTPPTSPAPAPTPVVEPAAPPPLIAVIEEQDSDDEDMMDDDLMAGLMNRLGSADSPAADIEMSDVDSQAPVSDAQVTQTPSETDALRAALGADDLEVEEEEEEEEEEGGLEEQVIPPGVVQTVVAAEAESEGEEGEEESEEEYDPFSTDAAEPAAA